MHIDLKSTRIKTIKLTGIFVTLALLSACGTPFHKVTNYKAGTVLVLPAHDVVQNGRPHEKGAGSGALLTKQVVDHLRNSSMKPVTTDNAKFGHDKITDVQAALSDGKRLNADYVLIMQLGEFQNAAPFSYRPDYVWLQEAILYRTNNGTQVWRLKKPWLLQKTNLGNHLPLINQIAESIAESILDSAGNGS